MNNTNYSVTDLYANFDTDKREYDPYFYQKHSCFFEKSRAYKIHKHELHL